MLLLHVASLALLEKTKCYLFHLFHKVDASLTVTTTLESNKCFKTETANKKVTFWGNGACSVRGSLRGTCKFKFASARNHKRFLAVQVQFCGHWRTENFLLDISNTCHPVWHPEWGKVPLPKPAIHQTLIFQTHTQNIRVILSTLTLPWTYQTGKSSFHCVHPFQSGGLG